MPILDKEKIKVGLLLDSYSIPAWEYLMLEKIIKSNVANIQIIVKNNSDNSVLAFNDNSKNRNFFLYNLYSKFDQKRYKRIPDAFEIKDTADLLTGIPEIKLASSQKSDNDYIEDKDIEKIKAFGVDVFIQLGFRNLKGKFLKLPRFGIWSYLHSDNMQYRGGPPGFFEVFENKPVIGCSLVVLNESLESRPVIYKSFSSIHEDSVAITNNALFWKSSSFVIRKLEEYYYYGENCFKKETKHNNLEFYDRPLYKTPPNGKTTCLLLRYLKKRIAKKILSKFYFEQWQLMFCLGDKISKSFHQFKKIIPAKDRFWADPFIVHKDDVYYIFIEELEFKDNKGYISVIQMDKKGNHSEPKKVLERPYHLSYPFIFDWKNEFYMIPESCENKSIELYKCTDFPYHWELHKKIFEKIDAVDTTLFFHNEKWWLFTNIRDNPGASTYDDELFLYYSNDPLSENWSPHPLNPIVSDVSKARSAGRIFEYEGNIYRPSQNCGGRYGRGLNLNIILKLSETEYEEDVVGAYEPYWDKNLLGVHHISCDSGLTFIDVCSRRSKYF
jgi:hypothetical protein